MVRAKQIGMLAMVAFGLVLAAPQGARADSFGETLAAGDLAQERAGNFDVNSLLVSNQRQEAENKDNEINGGVNSGHVIVGDGAMDGLRGIGQIVANSGAQGIAQGNIQVNVILNPAPSVP